MQFAILAFALTLGSAVQPVLAQGSGASFPARAWSACGHNTRYSTDETLSHSYYQSAPWSGWLFCAWATSYQNMKNVLSDLANGLCRGSGCPQYTGITQDPAKLQIAWNCSPRATALEA
jgi:hypothetical protein